MIIKEEREHKSNSQHIAGAVSCMDCYAGHKTPDV